MLELLVENCGGGVAVRVAPGDAVPHGVDGDLNCPPDATFSHHVLNEYKLPFGLQELMDKVEAA